MTDEANREAQARLDRMSVGDIVALIQRLHRDPASLTTAEHEILMAKARENKSEARAAIQKLLGDVGLTLRVVPGGLQCDVDGKRYELAELESLLKDQLQIPLTTKIAVLVEGDGFGPEDHLAVLGQLKQLGYSSVGIVKRGFLVEPDRPRDAR